MEANQSIISANRQQLMFIGTLFQTEVTNSGEPIKLSVKDKYEGIPFEIEVYCKTAGAFVVYRVITSTGEGLWQDWETPEDVERSFRAMSLI